MRRPLNSSIPGERVAALKMERAQLKSQVLAFADKYGVDASGVEGAGHDQAGHEINKSHPSIQHWETLREQIRGRIGELSGDDLEGRLLDSARDADMHWLWRAKKAAGDGTVVA